MDFDFIKVDFLGEYHAKFSLEHQVIGRWLVDEIGQDRTKIEQVYLVLEQAYANPMKELHLQGMEVSFSVLQKEVTIQENNITSFFDNELEENFSIYTSESVAMCGLDDFASMFDQWHDFVMTE